MQINRKSIVSLPVAKRLHTAGLFWPWAYYYYQFSESPSSGWIVRFDQVSPHQRAIPALTTTELLAWMPPNLDVNRETLRATFRSYVPIGKRVNRWAQAEFDLQKPGADTYLATYRYRGSIIAIPEPSEKAGYIPLIASSRHLADCLGDLALTLFRFGFYRFSDWADYYITDPTDAHEIPYFGPGMEWTPPVHRSEPTIQNVGAPGSGQTINR